MEPNPTLPLLVKVTAALNELNGTLFILEGFVSDDVRDMLVARRDCTRKEMLHLKRKLT